MKTETLVRRARALLPALQWLPELRDRTTLRADVLAGVTVALVLIPQSMAYAQLAGLPAYYGLYAAFLPPVVGAIFGSSRQLATGPVAMVSLLTAAALEPLATAGASSYVAYAILLALLVGLMQLALGLLRLGMLINFLSHPVVIGFTNAAAIIIATSQLGKIFGVSVEKAPHHYETVLNTVKAAVSEVHLPTFAIAVLAFVLMIGLRRWNPRLPGVLIAVAVTTVISWAAGFEQTRTIPFDTVADEGFQFLVGERKRMQAERKRLLEELAVATRNLQAISDAHDDHDSRTLAARYAVQAIEFHLRRIGNAMAEDQRDLRRIRLRRVVDGDGGGERFVAERSVPAGAATDALSWQPASFDDDAGTVVLHAGGRVVGNVPSGLPEPKLPVISWDALPALLSSALAIALIGFMEAISIAKAMATRTRQRLSANQELVGQGLANIVGSLFQSYPVSGSFSRSAVNIGAGAVTGFSSVVTGLVVVILLLFLTPLLYHLPQATLAAVIMLAVIGLVNVRSIVHAWRVQRHDGVVAVATFALTLALAPHLDRAIMIGVVLSLMLYLYRTMRPRVVVLARHADGMLRDADLFGLARCENITVIRFDGALYFANTSYFEDRVLERLANKPELRFVIVDAAAITEVDSTGEDMLGSMHRRLAQTGIRLLFANTKRQLMDALRASGFVDRLGKDAFFPRIDQALAYAWAELGEGHEIDCPLNVARNAD